MSTFCVFGIKKIDCVLSARKLIPSAIGKAGANRAIFSLAQHSMYSELLAEHLFLNDESTLKQIAPAFDAPQFAMDWINIAEKSQQARHMKIMYKGPKFDKSGAPIIRKGAQVKTWIEYKAQP